MKTYTKQDFHNPEQLTRQQVGDEYRLLLPEEADGRFAMHAEYMSVFGHWSLSGNGKCKVTYRVPIATPLPDGTVLSSNERCWSDELCSADGGFCTNAIIPNLWGDTLEPRKVVYCCGPMSSHPDDFNFPAFYAASESLKERGYFPINPAQLDCDAGYPLERLKELTSDEFQVFLKGAMKRDLDALQQCDAIALLPGWESSKGARAEKAVAEWLGLEVMYLGGKKENCQYCQGPCQGSTSSGCVGPEGTAGEEVWEGSRFEYGDVTAYAPDDPKGAAGALKAPFHLLPPDALEEVAKVMGEGARKYKAWNFIEANVCASTYIGAIGRHWASYSKGIDIDPESGLSHLSHLAANCLILLTAKQQGTLRDDRPKLR